MQNFRGGFINLNKQASITSLKSFAPIKKIFPNNKIGHIGTLDPAAEGVLPIAIGKATKLIDFILKDSKTYRALIQFGVETDTLDMHGKIIKSMSAEHITSDFIKTKLNQFIGEIDQLPPEYSAIKLSGQRAYQIKRRGEVPNLSIRKTKINKIEFINFITASEKMPLPKVELNIECNTGFYVRSFARDLARACNTVGTLEHLQRTSVSSFHIANAYKIEEITQNQDKILDFIIPMNNLIKLPKITLIDNDLRLIKNGNFINLNNYSLTIEPSKNEARYACLNKNNDLVCIAEIDVNNRLLKPFKVLI